MLRKKSDRRRNYISIQTKQVVVFMALILVILGTNIYIYFNVNKMIEGVNRLYERNALLNDLQECLASIHRNLEEFLDTRDTEAIEGYLRYGQEYKRMMEQLNTRIVDEENMLAEKNLFYMSENYLEIAEQAVTAKRGRNVIKYEELYRKADTLFSYINTYIYSLNNHQFLNNSDKYQPLFLTLKYSETSNLIILGMIGFMSMLLLIFLTGGMTAPLRRLAEAADIVAGGNLDVDLSGSVSNDEVGIVTNAFNQMVESLKSHIDQLRKNMELENAMREKNLLMEVHLKDAKLKYLQAQINPHFLFNTLNAGAQLAMMEGADRTYDYVCNVADFFRYNVKKNDREVTLREELELVDNYIYIINVRFSGDIRFDKEIDENLVNVMVPGMILQPLVENCINHGIREVEWEKIIMLSVCGEDEDICIRVRDNGVGMSREIIDKVLCGDDMPEESENVERGVGLSNVIKRLRMFFDREDIVEIASAGKNLGTEIVIRIPYVRRGKD